ncbi:MAG: polyhydroxybutyrate depolymerase [Parcubacteria group bacterium Gr01-1014_33]|nr:MAG: polyhydroxybutyrate depolymerase [Parcubacteria group bacterium Gr01-1014_33]
MKKIITFVLILIILAAGTFVVKNRILKKRTEQTTPSSPTGAAYGPGDYSDSLTVDGRSRTYHFRIPTGYTSSKQYPLVAVFHGGAGSGKKIASQTGFPAKADKEGFIAVFPDGIEHNWNDGRDTADAYKQGVDDVKFVRTLIEHLKSKLPIDSKKIFATGVSNGGMFSHRLGCEMADVFAAIAPDVGSLATNLAPRCSPQNPISVVVIQGTEDLFIPINGGDTKHKKFPRLGDGGLVLSAEDAMKFWASKNGCSMTPAITNLPLQVNDGTSVVKTSYTQCRDNSEVTYYIVNGMGHMWPPKSQVTNVSVSGPPSQNIDATEVFWEFFKTHPKQ